MVSKDTIENAYFDWMCEVVCKDRFGKGISYRKLLHFLHEIEFTYTIRRDRGRAEDGVNLRYRFPYECVGVSDVERHLTEPCSVLEMMLALAIRCEETIMDDPAYGDRTGQWFWNMVTSLGLGSMEDSKFDRAEAEKIVSNFLSRNYEPNGKGGLFTIRDCEEDLRNVEIWNQLCWYLDSIR